MCAAFDNPLAACHRLKAVVPKTVRLGEWQAGVHESSDTFLRYVRTIHGFSEGSNKRPRNPDQAAELTDGWLVVHSGSPLF